MALPLQIPPAILAAANGAGIDAGKIIVALELLSPNPLWAELLDQVQDLMNNKPTHDCYRRCYEETVKDYASLLAHIVLGTASRIKELPEA
jgi:hypothetical protein